MPVELHFLYDTLIESLLRIHQYSRVNSSEIDSETRDDMDHVADLIARRDMLILAASVRNFAEATKTKQYLKNRSIRLHKPIIPLNYPFTAPFDGRGSTISIYQAYSRIIHAIEFDILIGSRLIATVCAENDIFEKYNIMQRFKAAARSLDIIIFVKSEDKEDSLFKIIDLVDQTILFLDYCHSNLPGELHFFPRSIRDAWRQTFRAPLPFSLLSNRRR